MLFVDNRGVTDARINLALEEYVFRSKPAGEDVLLFYVNDRAIIIGRNQNTIEEIDADVVAERGVTVVRRVSGGGAVYHDTGNLNFSFMTPDVKARFNRYDHFTRPVIQWPKAARTATLPRRNMEGSETSWTRRLVRRPRVATP